MSQSLAIINADKLSAFKPADLTAISKLSNVEIHNELIRTYVSIGENAVHYQGLYLEARLRFDARQSIGDCETWTAYADRYFKKHDESLPTCLRRLRRALEGVNPATEKYQNKPKALPPPASFPASELTASVTNLRSDLRNLKATDKDNVPTLIRSLQELVKDATATADKLTPPAETADEPPTKPSKTTELRGWFATKFDRFKLRPTETYIRGQGGRMDKYDLVLFGITSKQVKAIGNILGNK